MNITISGHHYRSSDKVKEYLDRKIIALKKIFPFHSADIRIDEERQDIALHVQLQAGKKQFNTVQNNKTVYAAIDHAHDCLRQQLKKAHDRQISH